MWFTVTIAILLTVVAVTMIRQMRGRSVGGRGGRSGAGFVQGTLTVTGVTDPPHPDSRGQMFATVSGTIIGPGTEPAPVYGTMVLNDGQPWPTLGSDHPVIYKPGKAETSWHFGELPPQHEVPGPFGTDKS